MTEEVPLPVPKYSSTITTMSIPKDLADALKTISGTLFPPKKWTDVSRDVLWGYVAMHRARGNVE